MPTLAMLLDKTGCPIASPEQLNASVSWSARDGLAQAFDANGKRVAELHNARVEWIELSGIRIVGMEPSNLAATAFRLQAWQYNQ